MSLQRASQKAAVLADLQAGFAITPMDALRRYGCARLAARILELREEGWAIESSTVEEGGARFASYRLSMPRQEALPL